MKKILLSVLMLLCLQNQLKSQVANYIVLAEVYGGGGEQGSYWKNDYVLLYNPTETMVDLSTWSVQYAVFNSSNWQVVVLNGVINSGQYYFIQFGSDGSGSMPLPFTPNVFSSINLDKNKGKIALTNFQYAIAVSNPVGQSGIVDFVGYGNGTNAFEGSGPAPQTSTTESIRRKDDSGNNTYGIYGNGWDSNDNLLDFRLEGNLIINGPLPVQLSSFTAKILKSGEVKLDWRTETEVSNYGFEILRSAQNGNTWSKIGFVEGHGNSNSPKNYSFLDAKITSGKYFYRLKQIDTDGKFEYSKIIEADFNSPAKIELSQNYPNPFNPATIINYHIPDVSFITLKVYDVLGNEVQSLVNSEEPAGEYQVIWNAQSVPSGVYFYTLQVGSFSETRKMVLMK